MCMKRRATLDDLKIGLKLVVCPPETERIKTHLIGLVVVVDDIGYRHNMVNRITYKRPGGCIRSSVDLYETVFLVYDELTDQEKFIMALKGELIE